MKIATVPYGSHEYELTKQLRQKVLRDPLGLRLTAEDVEGEDRQIHIAAIEDGRVEGSVILKPISEDIGKLRQMAVSPASQGKGLGKSLVFFLEDVARTKKFKTVELHARVTAQVFYEKLGYEANGDIFTDVMLPHIAMSKAL